MMHVRYTCSILSMAIALSAASARAQENNSAMPTAPVVTPQPCPDLVRHRRDGPRISAIGSICYRAYRSCKGAELTQALRPTLGETLSRTPGVSATSFGPNASRPVLRGLQGERVRVLTDGIGSIDVSNTSVDHAVVVNPLLADRIEVLRGPSTLQFGSSAIGGVVNVIDKRIPRGPCRTSPSTPT